MADWRMKGEYLKNCNCLATCPCDTMGTPAPHTYCEGMVGMLITQGHFEDVDLSGLKWAGVVHFPGAMHEGNGDLEAFIDERANEKQRAALTTILTGAAGGPYFEIIKAVCPNVKGLHFVPIQWEFDKEARRANMRIPGFVETKTEPLMVIPTGDEQRVIVRMPGGFEYKEMEVARAATMSSTGGIKFQWKGTNSNLALVDHTPQGLAA